jgi:hypothetical protein
MGKKWTFVVWLAGDNNLEDYSLSDLKEMKQVGSTDAINIVAQLDRMHDRNTRRYLLRRNTSLEQDQVQVLGETNCGDPQVSIDFLTWAIRTYPADHYATILWDHGSGIDETDIYKRTVKHGATVKRKGITSPNEISRNYLRSVSTSRFRRSLFSTTLEKVMSGTNTARAILLDDTSKDFLDNVELKRVLTQVKRNVGRKIDVLGFDACLMNMIEIAYQLRNTLNVIAGSEQTEPGDGWHINE